MLTSQRMLSDLAVRYGTEDPDAVATTATLLDLAMDISLALNGHLERRGLSEGRLSLLVLLMLHPRGLTPSVLADRAGVTRGTVTGLLSRLEREWLVQRDPHPTDRRSVSIQITGDGVALLDLILPDHLRRLAHLTARLSTEERQRLLETLARIRDALAGL